MIALLAILICVVEMSIAHVIDLSSYETMILWQIEIVVIAAIGLLSNTSQRDKSILTVLVLWFSWIAASDWMITYAHPLFVQYDSLFFSTLIMWALFRPYFYVSADLSLRGDNVYIGFYQGAHAPFLSSLGALFGLPFSSMIIVAGDTVLRSAGTGKMTINSTAAIKRGSYTFIDTGHVATKEVFEEIAKCVDRPTKAFGVFRTKCIRNCEPVLSLVGLKPKTWFHKIPSIFYYQASMGAS